jgi:hypothetical protein
MITWIESGSTRLFAKNITAASKAHESHDLSICQEDLSTGPNGGVFVILVFALLSVAIVGCAYRCMVEKRGEVSRRRNPATMPDDMIPPSDDALLLPQPKICVPNVTWTPPQSGNSPREMQLRPPSQGLAAIIDATDHLRASNGSSPLVSILAHPHVLATRYEPPPRLSSVLSAEDKLLLEYAFQISDGVPEQSILSDSTEESSPSQLIESHVDFLSMDRPNLHEDFELVKLGHSTMMPHVAFHHQAAPSKIPEELVLAFESLCKSCEALRIEESRLEDDNTNKDISCVCICDVIVEWGPLKDAISAGCISEEDIRTCYERICIKTSIPSPELVSISCEDDFIKAIPTQKQRKSRVDDFSLSQFAALVEELQRHIDCHEKVNELVLDDRISPGS